MANKPVKVPIWNTGLSNNTEPSAARKITGWLFGEDPSSAFFNWLTGLTGDWLTWLDDRTNDVGVAPRIGLRGIETTAEDVNGTGITATGNGTGSAVKGVTPAGAGIALEADASAGDGYGVVAKAKVAASTRAALRVVPQDSNPGTAALGDIYINSVTKRVKAHNGTEWGDISSAVVSIGDGITSFGDFNGVDKVPFTNAIAALPAGGRILVKRGTYTFGSKLTISTADIVLEGEAVGVTLITGSFPTPVIELNANRVEVRNLSITNGNAGYAEGVTILSGVSYCKILDNIISLTSVGAGAVLRAAVRLQLVNNCWVSRNRLRITSTNDGLVADYCFLFQETVAAGTSIVDANRVTDNSLMVLGAGSASPVLIGIFPTVNTTGNLLVEGNDISGNIEESGTQNGSQDFLRIVCAQSGTGKAKVRYNAIQRNNHSSTGGGSSIILDSGGAAVDNLIHANAIVGNLGAWNTGSYSGVDTYKNSSQIALAGGAWIAATSGGAVTSRVTDSFFNQ